MVCLLALLSQVRHTAGRGAIRSRSSTESLCAKLISKLSPYGSQGVDGWEPQAAQYTEMGSTRSLSKVPMAQMQCDPNLNTFERLIRVGSVAAPSPGLRNVGLDHYHCRSLWHAWGLHWSRLQPHLCVVRCPHSRRLAWRAAMPIVRQIRLRQASDGLQVVKLLAYFGFMQPQNRISTYVGLL